MFALVCLWRSALFCMAQFSMMAMVLALTGDDLQAVGALQMQLVCNGKPKQGSAKVLLEARGRDCRNQRNRLLDRYRCLWNDNPCRLLCDSIIQVWTGNGCLLLAMVELCLACLWLDLSRKYGERHTQSFAAILARLETRT
ncbi:hypothetical protein B0I35DRAFT_429989 [Stachybotrys elegans]|uniref:Uncharacterized protein n=1 Tax=Stachybotrys elegans TaxID=80388 RepID=A0A8K0SR80_9HYPO|nr:hypothetical protein B0I35DRAFT_429989 [Stachybotrys elegans]